MFCVVLAPTDGRSDLVDLLRVPDELVPERDVALTVDNSVPWKKAWDQARYLARTGDYLTAEKKYEELLGLRGNIEQARWEYARLLLITGKWQKAATVLELLVERYPDRVAYLNGLGLASRKLDKLSRAIDLFRKAYEKDSTDLTALAGLVQGLVEVGRKREAFPLFEEIFSRQPDDLSLRRALANLAYELGKMETAEKLMSPLAEKKEADLDTLQMTARIYEELKYEKKAAAYWKRCLEHDPGHREAHGRLALYYEKLGINGNARALPHLLALLEKNPDNASLLSRICRIYIRSDRFAEALPYFERYVALHADNLDMLIPSGNLGKGAAEIDIIFLYRRLLAVTPDDLDLLDALTGDLLRLGNPEAALFMWEHKARLLPERIKVYQEIIDLLERLNRDGRLVAILEIIHRYAPEEVRVVSKLADLKVARGELQGGLEYFNKLREAGYEGEDLFAGRGRVYEELGRLASALADYKCLLVLQPSRVDIRRRCITLAGKLGENIFLKEQVAYLEGVNDPVNHDQDLILAARAFAEARDFEEAQARYQFLIAARVRPGSAREIPSLDPLAREAMLGLADLYFQEGLVFKAEQLLREIFLTGAEQGEVLARLFEIALSHKEPRISEAKVWLERYASLERDPGGTMLMKARFLSAAQDCNRAENLLEEFLCDSATGDCPPSSPSSRKEGISRRAGLLLIEIFIGAGDLGRAERQGLAMLEVERDREVLVVLQKTYQAAGREKAAAKIKKQLLDEAHDSHDLLMLAELYGKHGLPAALLAAAEKALDLAPDSLAGAFLLAGGLAAEGRFSEALKLLEGMAAIYPGNKSIILKMAGYFYRNGQYVSALHYCNIFLEADPGRLDAHFLKTQCITALGDRSYWEKAVKNLFPLKTAEILENNVVAAGMELPPPPGKTTVLQWLGFVKPEPSAVAEELMEARQLLDNSSKKKKTLNYIAARLYARYRWEQKFGLASADE
ncbi:MAG: tetratricopeptide repeat protein [Desulfobulbaceae bacterium]|nr:tetratricopeptide repeat protein [Desulfobulbaceae bacterium]